MNCVYVAIGQKESPVARWSQTPGARRHGLHHRGRRRVTTRRRCKYVAPYAGCAMAEYFMYKRAATPCVYDDLSKQAAAYRQLSLLLRRPPGREAYPGDVFYLHSRLWSAPPSCPTTWAAAR